MIINWYGEACFLIEASGLRILTDPPAKDSGIVSPRLKPDILIFSNPQTYEEVPGVFVVSGPGEYEFKGVEIRGLPVYSKDGQVPSNTTYLIQVDDMAIAHLGFLNTDLTSENLEVFSNSDVIFLPVGGGEVLDASSAVSLINRIEPKIVIPALYAIKGLKRKADSLGDFLKESGASNSPQPKLVLKKKDLDEAETKVVILQAV